MKLNFELESRSLMQEVIQYVMFSHSPPLSEKSHFLIWFCPITFVSMGFFSDLLRAGGFGILEQNAAGIGDYHAGGAAIANDTSTGYYNPAGLVRLKRPQLDMAAMGVSVIPRFTGQAQQNTFDENGAIYPPSNPGYSQRGSTQGGTLSFIPAFYAAIPLSPRTTLGWSVAVPFGLAANWSENSFVRYAATRSAVKTLNMGPSLGYRLNPNWSLGFGAYVQYVDATFNSVVGTGNFPKTDLFSRNFATGWAPVWNTGVLWELSPRTRIGFSYQSAAHHHLKGKSQLSKDGQDAIVDSQYSQVVLHETIAHSRITFPSVSIGSIYHEIDPRWALMSSVYYTRWSVIQTIKMTHIANVIQYDSNNQPFDPWSTVAIETPHHFKNTWTFSLGAHYRINSEWTLLMGGGYDQTPTHNRYRDLRLPDNDRIIASLGVEYSPTPDMTFHLGWMHVFVKDAPLSAINRFQIPVTLDDTNTILTPGEFSTVDGISKTKADVLGAQVSWRF